MTPGPIQVALQVGDACEACGLLSLVGGSLASSIGGEPRTTLDADMHMKVLVSLFNAGLEASGR